MTAGHTVSSTLEDYLEAILSLIEAKGEARVSDLAAELSVHKSTVTAALKALAEKGLLKYAPYETATLTVKGRGIARRVVHDHEVIRDFLRSILLVEEGAAEKNACRMEHVMDKEVLDRLVVFAKSMKKCPQFEEQCLRLYARNVKRDLP